MSNSENPGNDKGLSLFERYLSLWVALMLMLVGICKRTAGWFVDSASAEG